MLVANIFLYIALCCLPVLVVIGLLVNNAVKSPSVDWSDIVEINNHLKHSDMLRRRSK